MLIAIISSGGKSIEAKTSIEYLIRTNDNYQDAVIEHYVEDQNESAVENLEQDRYNLILYLIESGVRLDPKFKLVNSYAAKSDNVIVIGIFRYGNVLPSNPVEFDVHQGVISGISVNSGDYDRKVLGFYVDPKSGELQDVKQNTENKEKFEGVFPVDYICGVYGLCPRWY